MALTQADEIFERVSALTTDDPCVLWHYTSTAALLKILESNAIHLTCYDFLNDPGEGKLAHDLVQECWENALDRASTSVLSLEHLRSHARKVPRAKYKKEEHQCTFVFSGSSKGDSLGQWARYGDDGAGVAIGIRVDPSRMSELNLKPGWRFGPHLSPVRYWCPTGSTPLDTSSEDFPAQLSNVLSEFLSTVRDPTDLHNGLFITAERLAPCVKALAYSEECEVRIYISVAASATNLYHIKNTAHGLAPVVSLPLGSDAIRVVALRLGPKVSEETLWSVEHWLTSKFQLQGVRISQSQLAYR